jgi:16S rRNA C1402 N4-methylase RsmH
VNERFTLINEILDSSNDSCVLRIGGWDLADLGVSSHQFDVAERFSTRFDAELYE